MIRILIVSTLIIATDWTFGASNLLEKGSCEPSYTALASEPKVRVDTPSNQRDYVREAVRITDGLVAQGMLPKNDPAAFREELIRGYNEVSGSDKRQTVLFIDTPVMSEDGKPLNRKGVTLVVDHHAAYAPENGMDNSGTQIIQRLTQAAAANIKDGKVDVEAALKQFDRELFGENPGRIVLSADNLADAAEVIAILRSKLLQRRILDDPELAKMLTESGHFTDFFVFGGDGYEKGNQSPQSQNAIALSKAIMNSHSELLQKYGVAAGDRIEGLSPKEQRKILLEAVRKAQAILIEATRPDTTPLESPRVQKQSGDFNSWRGGPDALKKEDGQPTSYAAAVKSHEDFVLGLPEVLFKELSRDWGPGSREAGPMIEARARAMSRALNERMFGHNAINTGHQFADWAASPMANTYNPTGRRPLKFELGGKENSDIGKPVIIAKSGPPEEVVDVTPYANALNNANEKAKKRLKKVLLAEGKSEAEVNETVAKVQNFTTRGNTLLFNFGGHALTRAEVELVVAETALALERAGN